MSDRKLEQQQVFDPAHADVDHNVVEHGGIEDELHVVENAFEWFNSAATTHLTQLGAEFKRDDDPPWDIKLAGVLLEVALQAGASAAGRAVANSVGNFMVAEIPNAASRSRREAGKASAAEVGGILGGLVETMFDKGTKAGIEAGKAKLGAEPSGDVIDHFITAQKLGIAEQQKTNQDHFIRKTRHMIRSPGEARALALACTNGAISVAATKQRDVSRDAYVSYLAQTKYGAIRRNRNVPMTTNMMTAGDRQRVNAGTPGVVPSEAPESGDSLFGNAPGVLEVFADLPAFDKQGEMTGVPTVEMAFLNGVNSVVRKHYEGRFLEDIRLPRHVTARVAGDHPDFSINLDENGWAAPLPRTQGAWLRARQQAGSHQVESNAETAQQRGLAFLLQDLRVTKVGGRMLRRLGKDD